jgi:nitric oxide reductase large subunit
MVNPIGRDNPFFIVTPPLLWGVYFGVVYAVNGVACAKGIGGSPIGGIPMVNVVLLGSTAVTLVLLAGLALLAWARFRPVKDAGGHLHSDDPGLSAQARRRFVALAGLLQALLAIVATIYIGMQVFLSPNC